MGNILFNNLKNIKLTQIERNPEQPRKYFDPEAIDELAVSIKRCGVINPITVRKKDGVYQIIAGERRFRAAKVAGLLEIPCLVLSTNEQKSSIISIVENIQRYDLNFVEEALAYQKLIDEFSFKQEQVALKIGKTQSAVANKIRILKLGEDLLKKILENNLTERHARALLKLPEEKREQAVDFIVENGLNVAKTDEYIERVLNPVEPKKSSYFRIKADVRFFINTVNKSIQAMKESGVHAKVNKEHTEEGLVYTITIPTTT